MTSPFWSLTRALRRSGRKALTMSRTTNPPVSLPEPVDDRLGKLIDAIGQLTRQQQSLLDAIKPMPPAPPAQATADLRSFVADLFRQHTASERKQAVRDDYIRQHLTDLPEVYRRTMPATDDPATLADAEQAVRAQYRQDLARLKAPTSVRPADAHSAPRTDRPVVDGFSADDPGGQPPVAAIDYARLSPMQQIALGLKSAGRSSDARSTSPAVTPKAGEAVRSPADSDSYDYEPLFVGAD